MDFKKYNISSPEGLLEFFKNNMAYGCVANGRVYLEGENFNEEMNNHYHLRTGEDFIKSGYGVCWDFAELEREFFKQANIKHECYFALSFYSRAEGGPTHTFVLFEEHGKWYWFEYAFSPYRGIWEYETKQKALSDVIDKFSKFNNRPYEKIELYKTKKAAAGLNPYEFVSHCLEGEKIEIGRLYEH